MTSRSKKIEIQVRLCDGVLIPVTQYDAEAIEKCKKNQLFNLKMTSKRSDPHHKLCWVILNRVVVSTGKWPTADHLHHDIKYLTGYYKSQINKITGEVFYVVDSIKFDAMNQNEFNVFFKNAMQILTEKLEIDPMELLR